MTGLVDAAHATFKPTEQRNVAVTLQKNMLRPSETNAAWWLQASNDRKKATALQAD